MKKPTITPKDLTTGSPAKKLLFYALPMFASMFFQQAYNLADSWIAGNYIGSSALGAVGTVLSVSFYLFCQQPKQKTPQQKMPRQ